MKHYLLAFALCGAAACDNIFAPSGTSEDTLAPDSIIGRGVDMHPYSVSCGEIGVHWGRARMEFIDSSTIRGRNTSGGTFDYPSDFWSYRRMGDASGELFIDWANGSENEYAFEFEGRHQGDFVDRGSWTDGRELDTPAPCAGRDFYELSGKFYLDYVD